MVYRDDSRSLLWHLTDAQREIITSQLLQCPSIEDNSMRKAVIEHLPQAIHHNINQTGMAKSDVLRLVKACSSYPWGIETLIDIIRFFESGSVYMAPLYATLSRLNPQPFTLDQIARLKLIVEASSISDGELISICNACLPSPHLALPDICSRGVPFCVLNWLGKMGASNDGRYPLLDFVARLNRHLSPDLQAKLRQWVDEMAAHLQIPPDLADKLLSDPGDEASVSSPDPLYMLVDIDSRGASSFYARAWLCKGDSKRLFHEAELATLDGMPEVIEQSLDAITRDLVTANNNLIIEFFLPIGLLCHKVDHWSVESDPIGIRYPVVVRSRDRAITRRYWPSWRQHWDPAKLRSVATDESFAWANSELEPERRSLRVKLGDPNVLCLLLTFLPAAPSESKPDLLLTMLRAGTPIALWPRQKNIDSDMVIREFKSLLSAIAIGEMPDRVWKARQRAWSTDEQLLGYHLTLLWDDFDRMPPEFYLEEPAI